MTTVRLNRPLRRDTDFRRLFVATAISQLGQQISLVALPILAVTALSATPGQIGVLGMLGTIAFLLIGLPAGPWIDRVRRRPVMIAADLARAAFMGWVPVAWWLGALTIQQLYVVVLLTGVATVFFDVAAPSHLPSLVGRDRLVQANSAIVGLAAVNDIAGRGAGGYLIQLVGAPFAVVIDALSYLWSALFLARIRRAEPEPAPAETKNVAAELREGVRFVLRDRILRPIVIDGAATNLCIILVLTMLPVIYAREPGLLGLFLAAGGLGILAGAGLAGRVGRWLGNGRALWIASLAMAPFGFLLPLAADASWLWAATAGWVITMVKVGIDNVIKTTFRQSVTPDRLLGRMNAIFRFLFTGTLAVGAGLSGLLGELIGVRAPLWAAAIGLAVIWPVVFFSPLRTMRDLPKS